ncbi:hypothetical protein A1F99_057890 [Pyrenophora tritici-repentis]|nr:hypothetical protein A1F99_140220 [Pyrenophora tritici-repentis]KAF7448740.1 hypothetical protein A1F99_057890 [Pyrenophora tritici-repentis]
MSSVFVNSTMGSSPPDYLQLRSLAEKLRPSISLAKKQFWIAIQCHKPQTDNDSTKINFLWIRAKSKATIRKVHKAYKSVYSGNTILLLGETAPEPAKCIRELDNFRDRMIVLIAIPTEGGDDSTVDDSTLLLHHSFSRCTEFKSIENGARNQGAFCRTMVPLNVKDDWPATNFTNTYVATAQPCSKGTLEQGTFEDIAMETLQIQSSMDSAKGMLENQ